MQRPHPPRPGLRAGGRNRALCSCRDRLLKLTTRPSSCSPVEQAWPPAGALPGAVVVSGGLCRHLCARAAAGQAPGDILGSSSRQAAEYSGYLNLNAPMCALIPGAEVNLPSPPAWASQPPSPSLRPCWPPCWFSAARPFDTLLAAAVVLAIGVPFLPHAGATSSWPTSGLDCAFPAPPLRPAGGAGLLSACGGPAGKYPGGLPGWAACFPCCAGPAHAGQPGLCSPLPRPPAPLPSKIQRVTTLSPTIWHAQCKFPVKSAGKQLT